MRGFDLGFSNHDAPSTGATSTSTSSSWPPKDATSVSLYFDAAGKLSFTPAAGSGSEFDEYTSDPAKPVPVIGDIGQGMPGDYMTYDQRFGSQRPDVLVYETAPLERDIAEALIGFEGNIAGTVGEALE